MDDATTVKDNFFILSEFFSTLSKEKSENRKKAENTIAVLENDKAPEDTPINISEDTLEPQIIRSDLANLFKNLEHVLLEAKEESVVSTENESEFENIRGLSFDEQTRLNEFSKLLSVELISTRSGRNDTVDASPTALILTLRDLISSPLSVVTTHILPLMDFTFPLS